jgi:hypothetical protein
VSCLLAEKLVLAAEASTGVRPWRRTELLRQRWQAQDEQANQAQQRLTQRQAALADAQAELQACTEHWQAAETTVMVLVADYQERQRPECPHSQLAHTWSHNHQTRDGLLERVDETTVWVRVGANADMVAWPAQTLSSRPYPVDLALQRFHTGPTRRHGAQLHFGRDTVTADLPAWFAFYNGRQISGPARWVCSA